MRGIFVCKNGIFVWQKMAHFSETSNQMEKIYIGFLGAPNVQAQFKPDNTVYVNSV